MYDAPTSMLLTFTLILGLAQGQTPAASPKQSLIDIAAVHAKAEAGDANAQFLLGKAFEDGSGVTKSEGEAAKWYWKAAEQGNAAAQDEIGVLLWTGNGVQKDKVKAVEWYRKAAKQGNGSAMFNLGTAYFNGEGGIANTFRAYVWFYLAQDRGSALTTDAVQRFEKTATQAEILEVWDAVAGMYVAGREVPKDYAAAAKWYQMSIAKGSTGAAVELAGILYDGGTEKPDYNGSLRWCQFAADHGNRFGMYCVGRLYQEGKTGPKDSAEAIRWFEKAAALGDAPSCLQLGRMFWNGDGTTVDKVSAYKWALLASEMLPPEKQWVAKQDAGSFQAQMTPKEMKQGYKAAQAFKKTIHW